MKKIFFVVFSLCLAAVLTGCNKDDLNLPEVRLNPDNVIADQDHGTIRVHAEVTDEGSSDLMEYGICYSTTNDHPTMRDQHMRLTSDDPKAMEALIENAANGTYYFRAYAVNGEGVGYSDVVRVVFAVNIYKITVHCTGADYYNMYCGVNNGSGDYHYGNAVFEYHYGETATISAYSRHPDVFFRHWSDGSTEATRTFTMTSNIEITAVFEYEQHDYIGDWLGTYSCTATNVATGQSETWGNVQFVRGGENNNELMLLNFGGSEGLIALCQPLVMNDQIAGLTIFNPIWNDGMELDRYREHTFINGEGVTCYAVPHFGNPEDWELELWHQGNGFVSGGPISSDFSLGWTIYNASTNEVLSSTPQYRNITLTKVE